MKRWIAGILCIAMLLSLLAGCGAPAEETQAAAETVMQAEPTTEPTTEPTIDPEELFLQSLPADVRRAYEVGLVTREDLNDLERIATVGEASAMLQTAYVHRTGVESKMFKELMSRDEYASRNATRGWLMGMPGLADLELTHGEQYENYEQWFRLTGDNGGWADLWAAFDERFGAKGIIPMDFLGVGNQRYNAESDTVSTDVVCSLPVAALDFEEYVVNTGPGTDPMYHGLDETIAYAFKIFDDTNGKKFMELEDGYIHPYREITLGEMAEHALVYYNFPNPMAYPEYVAPEEVGTYNTTIIPAELLAKDTDLPEASCRHLPQWHGVVMDDMELLTSDIHLDDNVYEYEIKAVKDAGFNYICLNLDFNWLQDYQVFNIQNNASTAFRAIARKEDDGKLSVQRLEKLDQVLAWCMEYDIHLNLRVTGVGGFYNSHAQNLAIDFSQTGLDTRLAQMWQAIARRYAGIPNTYLSFTLLGRPDISPKNNLLLPSVDAIREVSPDRCIIAEIYGWGNLTAEPFAEKGVALSFVLQEPSAVLKHDDHYEYDNNARIIKMKNPAVIDIFTWPYQDYDAASMLSVRLYNKAASCTEVMAVAEQYGVGFMLGEFGISLGSQENTLLPRTRYADDAYQAMILDITSTVEGMGYGWCFSNWYGYFGIANAMPIIKNTTYEQVEDYPYYIDQTMLGWFREINNKSGAPQAAAEVSSGTPKDAKAVVDALQVPKEQYSCYLAAAEAGISLDNISDKPINAREMVELVDQFVAHVAPDKLAGWKTQYLTFRGAPLEPISRMDAMAYLFLAMRYTEDPAYADPPSFVCFLMDQVEMDWDAEYLNWQLFGGFESLPTYPVDFYEDVYTDCTLDGAAHYFNLGWRDGVTGDYLLDLDPATNTFLYQEDATWQDVILALGRLLPKTNDELVTTLFPDSTFLFADKDAQEIEAYRTQAAERKEAIVNSKTSIVKADTFVPGETYSGKAYYVSPDGDDSNDGLTPETAWKTTNAVTDAHYSNKLKRGDAVFFRRGGTYRVDPCKSLAVHEGVTYSAYGEGAKPILTLSEGNKADPGFWELYYDQNGMKIWKYHQQITDVGGIVFNDSSYATRVYEWPDNGKWQAVDVVRLSTEEICDSWSGSPVRYVGTGEYRKVEENMPENLTYISRVDISGASYPINFVENPKTGMPYTGELYLRCDEGNPGEVFDEIAILGYSDVSKGSWFQIIPAFDVDDFVLDNLCIKYYVDTAVCGGLKSENVVIQNCVVGWGGNRMHEVSSPEPTATFASIGDGIYCIANNATIRNNYMYMSANGCTFENGPMGYEKKMGVYTCTGNLMENCSEGIRAFLIGMDEGDVPFEKMVIQDNMILDTGVSINNGNSEIPAAIDISKGEVFAEEILVADNICIGSTVAMMRMGNPLTADAKETYRNNVWAHDPKLPMAAMMNIWSNTWVSMDGAK